MKKKIENIKVMKKKIERVICGSFSLLIQFNTHVQESVYIDPLSEELSC